MCVAKHIITFHLVIWIYLIITPVIIFFLYVNGTEDRWHGSISKFSRGCRHFFCFVLSVVVKVDAHCRAQSAGTVWDCGRPFRVPKISSCLFSPKRARLEMALRQGVLGLKEISVDKWPHLPPFLHHFFPKWVFSSQWSSDWFRISGGSQSEICEINFFAKPPGLTLRLTLKKFNQDHQAPQKNTFSTSLASPPPGCLAPPDVQTAPQGLPRPYFQSWPGSSAWGGGLKI